MSGTVEIVVVGSNMMDFTSYAPRLPKEGETIHGTEFSTSFGGKGANQCVAAAKLGAKTAFVGRVGDDIFGAQYLENLKSLNVDVSKVKKTPGFTNGIAQIIVSETGQNQIVIVAGANSQLTPGDVTSAQHLIKSAEILICQLETAPEVAIKAMELCPSLSILNGAPALSKYDEDLLKLPGIFCVNETEAGIFTGLKVESLEEAENAVEKLLDKGCKKVILTMGKDGALYASQEERTPVHVGSVGVKCADSTGAGDAFIGALAYFLSHRKEMEIVQAIGAACFVAADSVTRPGTQRSYPGPEILTEYFGR